MIFRKIIFLVAMSVALSNCKKIPADVAVCPLDNEPCILKAGTEFIQKYHKGIPEFGLPKLDPFKINQLAVTQGGGGPLTLDLKLHNVYVEGFSQFVFENLTGFSKDIKVFEIGGETPKLTVKGKYKINGRVFVLPIQGNGDFNITIDKLRLAIKLKPTKTLVDGKHRLGVDKLKVRVQPKRVTTRFRNLFNGNKILGDNMNIFLNNNWNIVWDELSESVNGAISEIVRNIFSNVFGKYAYEDFFVNDKSDNDEN